MRQGAAAVHHRGLVELARDAAEELHHQEDEEGVDRQEFRHDQRQEGVHPAEIEEQHVLRDQRHVVGQHQRAEHQREPEFLAAELQPGEGVGRRASRTARLPTTLQQRDDQRVEEERAEADAAARTSRDVGVEADSARASARSCEDLALRPERAREHPQQRIEHQRSRRRSAARAHDRVSARRRARRRAR